MLSCFRNFENQLLDHVDDLVKYCKDNCIKNIIIGGKVSDPGKLGYLTCNRIQIYPPPSAIQDTMVAITASSSGTATCRYIATVKALTKMKDEEDMKRGVQISGTITTERTEHYPKCPYNVTTLVNEKIMGFDCPILDINDSKQGKVGLVVLVDMSTNKVPTESDKHLKITRKNLRCWKQPSIYAWPIKNSGLKEINDVSLLIINDLAKSVYNFITTIQLEGNGLGSANRS